MTDEPGDFAHGPSTDPFTEGIEAHLDAMLAGTQRYFQAIGTEINTNELRELMTNRPAPRQAVGVHRVPSPVDSRPSRVGPVRRPSPPAFHTFGPYQFPAFGVPLPGPPLVSPTGAELFDAVLPFGAFPRLRDPRLPVIPEEYHAGGEVYSIDELCMVFAGDQDYNRDDPCAICQDALGEMSEESPQVQLLCSHRYHTSCLRKWLQEKRNCPACRKNVNIE